MTDVAPLTRRCRLFLRLHFQALTLLGLIVSLICDWAEFYRTFLYLNLVLTAVALYNHPPGPLDRNVLIFVLSVPTGFMLLHMLAAGKFELVKDVRHLWLAAFVTLGVWTLPKQEFDWLNSFKESIATALILFFIIVQLIGFLFELTDEFSGAMRNPHYLSYYSSLALIANCALLSVCTGKQRILLISTAIILLGFISVSSSRPAWIALLAGMCIWLIYHRSTRKAWLVILVPLFLYASNAANVADRLDELASNIRQEERVAIWKSAIRMQATSSHREWLIGHGIDQFSDNFTEFSPIEFRDRMYQFPHNSFLEITYTSGLSGLVILISIYCFIYVQLVKLAKNSRPLAVAALIGLTFHWIMVLLTFPLFSAYNMYPFALLMGATLYSLKYTPGGSPTQSHGGE